MLYEIIRADARIEYVTADWYRHGPDSGWSFERRGMAWNEPHHVLVKRFPHDRVVLVTDLGGPF